jgi:hypothetical protein
VAKEEQSNVVLAKILAMCVESRSGCVSYLPGAIAESCELSEADVETSTADLEALGLVTRALGWGGDPNPRMTICPRSDLLPTLERDTPSKRPATRSAPARKPIRPRQAIEVWERCGGHCYWCGEDLAPSKVVFDHYLPIALGGEDDTANLVLSCSECNAAKGSMHPRQAEFWFHWGQPRCVAKAMYEWESGVDDSESWPFFVGGESIILKDGSRQITEGPISSGSCENAGCPDCA